MFTGYAGSRFRWCLRVVSIVCDNAVLLLCSLAILGHVLDCSDAVLLLYSLAILGYILDGA